MSIDWMNILAIPLIGALIGWVTNLIAVKMLFRPRKPIRIMGFSIQGVFPHRQSDLAAKIGSLVAEQLISSSEVTKVLRSEKVAQVAQKSIDQFIERAIWEKLPKAVPMVAMFLTPQLVATVKDAFREDIPKAIDSVIESLSQTVEDELNVEQLVAEKVASFSVERVEEILLAIMKREFKFIEVVGGVLGFLIGVLQLAIVYI